MGMPRYAMEFDDFVPSDWSIWIERALLGQFERMGVQRDEEIYETIVRIFKSVPLTQRSAFSGALAEAIECSPILPSYAERFFNLLQIAQVTKPKSKHAIRKLLVDGVGKFEFEQAGRARRLQGTLLSAAGKYEVDEWLRDYIWRSMEEYRDFEYGLLCMRVLSWRPGDDSWFKFHSRLIPRFEDETDVSQYAMELFPIARRTGFRLLVDWYLKYSKGQRKLPLRSVALWRKGAERALRRFGKDPHAELILTAMQVERKPNREGFFH